eukprot:scaffold56433_cov14-Prasinocladus_malaysianus.AAC.1
MKDIFSPKVGKSLTRLLRDMATRSKTLTSLILTTADFVLLCLEMPLQTSDERRTDLLEMIGDQGAKLQ